jgi:hypothetical protein
LELTGQKLEDPVTFTRAVAVKGALGFFNVDESPVPEALQ